MAIYINAGHTDENGKEWKHLNGDCPVLIERAEDGFAVNRVRNVDRRVSVGEGVRYRCPVCFSDGAALGYVPEPGWLGEAAARQRAQPNAFWTYDLMWRDRHASQVGMATDLRGRLSSRWRGTCAGRLTGNDSIPWLYDAIVAGHSDEIVLEVEAFATRQEALDAEKALRDRKRADGWHVSSDR